MESITIVKLGFSTGNNSVYKMPGGSDKPTTRSKSSTVETHDLDEIIQAALSKQEAMFTKIIETQQQTLRGFLQTYMETVDKRMDKFIQDTTRNICELKSSLEFSQGEIDQLKNNQKENTVKIDSVVIQLDNIVADLKKIENNCDYIENQSRRNNLRIDGIEEIHGENWAQTEDLVRENLQSVLSIPDAVNYGDRKGTQN